VTAALRVLVAEDETLIRLDLRGLLEAAGFEVCAEALDGEEAVQLARETEPDVALLDVKMPRLDGIEAARRILDERPIPIVMVTAYGERELVSRAVEAGVFGYLGGQAIIEKFVLGLNMNPVMFLIVAQLIIFLLGWPLEWTEIIVIFVPIFLPLLKTFAIDPLLFGVMVAVNLQTAFLSPPVAMSAFYLKGIAPPHVTLNQIYNGMYPFLIIQIICLFLTWYWPELTLWLPRYLYGD